MAASTNTVGTVTSNAGKHTMDIQTFKDAFDGGTRPNRFVVVGNIGTSEGGAAGGNLSNSLLVKAASMPSQTLGILQVPFRGRFAKVPGDRAYPEWTFTVLDQASKDGGMRRQFEKWHEEFNWHRENRVKNTETLAGRGDLFTKWAVYQLDMLGNEIRCISLHKCWPVEVGAIDLSYDTADQLTEYSVTLAYDYLQLCSSSGDASGRSEAAKAADSDPNGEAARSQDGVAGQNTIIIPPAGAV